MGLFLYSTNHIIFSSPLFYSFSKLMEYMVPTKVQNMFSWQSRKACVHCLHFSLHSDKVLTEETRKRSMSTHRRKNQTLFYCSALSVYEKRFINIHTHHRREQCHRRKTSNIFINVYATQ